MAKRLGYTIIELLVVMAVVAILVVTALAMLSPIEQLKKGRDSRRLAEMEELYRSLERFFIAYGHYPWQEAAVLDTTLPDVGVAVNPEFGTDMDSYLLIDRNELRPMFANRASVFNKELWVSLMADNRVTVCFEPESRSARSGGMGQIKTMQNTLPSPTNDCDISYGLSTACYVCAP